MPHRGTELNDFVLRLLGKSVRIDKIKAAKTIEKVNFEGESQQLRDRKLFICFATKQTLLRLSDDGDIDEKKKDRLYQAVRDFYQRAVLEANWKLSFQDDTLIHTRFVDFFQRENASFEYE